MVEIVGNMQSGNQPNAKGQTSIEFIITKGRYASRHDFMDDYFKRKEAGKLAGERIYNMNNKVDIEQWVNDSKEKLTAYHQRFEKAISLIPTKMSYRDIMNELDIPESEMNGLLEIIAGIPWNEEEYL